MKNKLKYFISYIKNLNSFLISIVRVILYSKFNVGIKFIKEKGTCYILGNGPSLKHDIAINFEFLKGQNLFVVNDFAISDNFELLKPKYYVFADPSYWGIGANDEIILQCNKVLEIIFLKVDWPMYIVIPNSAFKSKIFQNKFYLKSNIKIIDFNDSTFEGFEITNNFFYKYNLGIPPMKNVLVACIYLATNMGFLEINLLGADHSWTESLAVNDTNTLCIKESHFYDSKKMNFTPFKKIHGGIYKMHEVLREYAQMFESYHILLKYVEFKGVKVFNRCSNSFIDAFERKKMDI